MSELCLTLGCPEVIRLSLVDRCTGAPIDGSENGYALGCPRNWTIEPQVREGESSEFVSDCGFVQARDVQDDQPVGFQMSFETAVRSVELEALATGSTLITDSGNNVGTYTVAGAGCTSPAPDPHFVVEAFYKLALCASGADHVRYVFPNTHFKVTEIDKEGTITFFRYTGISEPGFAYPLTAGARLGPFDDFPAYVATFLDARPADERTVSFNFEETISIEGTCGTIAVGA